MASRRDREFNPRSNILSVIKAFARGDKPGSPGTDDVCTRQGRIYARNNPRLTCSTDGEKLYSYDEPIAIKLGDEYNTVIVREHWGSNTTSHHIRACKILLPQYGFRVEVASCPREAVDKHKKRHRYASARPHGRCEFATYCVEHEADPSVESCKEVDHAREE